MVPRVYIAAPYPMLDEAVKLRTLLQEHGIESTARWVVEDTTICREWAEVDLADVMQAHAVVIINPPAYANSGTGGRHVEVGYALANSMPVFILGHKSNLFHELCMVVEDELALVAALRQVPLTYSYQHHVMALRALFARVHRANHKWWVDLHTGQPIKRNVGELLMLTVSELAEAMEGHRKDLRDDKLPEYSMFTVEIADALIRLFDIAGSPICAEDVAKAFDDKMAFNAVRADHSHEHRKSEHGKKY